MNLQEIKIMLLIVVCVSALFVASPALQRFLTYPQTEFFTELWVLGSEHEAADYPFNITVNENYNVFLGVGNQLGHCAYYMLQVKFCDLHQSATYGINQRSSTLPSLYNITFFVEDNETWELPIVFSYDYVYNEDFTRVYFDHLLFNEVLLDLNGTSTELDALRNGFFGNLFFELWIYNENIGSFQYHERFVDLKFNMTNLVSNQPFTS